MPPKFTQHFVEKLFQERGCVLLDQYVNSHSLVKYRCVCGYTSYTLVPQFVRGQRCMACRNRLVRSSKNHYCWNPDAVKYKDLLHGVLLRLGQNKEAHIHEILGYSAKELMTHLQQFPNWKIICKKPWNIDHIFPVKAFQDHGIYDPYIICALANLQPLSELANKKKSSIYSKRAFLIYCEEHQLAIT